jgi:hypothetical protein
MRGALLNYLSGMQNVVANSTAAFNMDIGEMMFWLWRVRKILVTFTMSATVGPAEGGEPDEDPIPSYSFSNVYYCPLVQFEGTSSGPRTEKDQVITRAAWASQPYPRFGGIKEIQASEDGFADFSLSFGGGARHQPVLDERLFWQLIFAFDASISNTESSVFAIHSQFSPGFESTPFVVQVKGIDLILNRSYFHTSEAPNQTISVFQQRGGLCTGGTGSLVIEPFEFYEWRDQDGFPLYDSTTGGYA